MAVSSFSDFCESICGLLGVDPPPLEEGDEGEHGFTLTFGDALVGFTEGWSGDQPGVMMSVKFGAPPLDKAHEVLEVLMSANFELAHVGAPSFARDPETGDIWLNQWVLNSQLDLHTVYAGLVNATAAVSEWHDTYFLESAHTGPHLVDAPAVLGQYA